MFLVSRYRKSDCRQWQKFVTWKTKYQCIKILMYYYTFGRNDGIDQIGIPVLNIEYNLGH